MSEEIWWKKTAWTYPAARKTKFVQEVHRAFFRKIDSLPLPRGARCLDAGCGDGNCAFKLAERGLDVVGLDFGDAILEQAKKRQRGMGVDNVHFEWGDLNSPLKYGDNEFDIVTSMHALMKVKKAKDALREFHRILKPGGYAVITITASDEEFSSWFRRYIRNNGVIKGFWDIRWLVVWNLPYVIMTKKSERRDEWRWPPETLARNMEAAGFKTLSVESVPYTHVGCSLGVFQK